MQETVQKVRKAQVKSDAQKLISLARSADKLGSAIDHALSDTEQLYRYVVSDQLGDGVSETTCKTFAKLDTRSARDLAGALKDLTSVVRNLYGLPTIQEQNAMDIAAARLEMDRQRARLDDGDEDETGVVEIAPVLEEEQEDGT